VAAPTGPDGRFHLAFDQPTLTWSPSWTRIDSHPSLVASYTIDRGRQYELDQTDVGRAVVQINDPDGLLDPTNSSGPYYGWIEPLLQAVICRWNPISDLWHPRFRGFVEDYSYDLDPSQRVNRLTLSLVDIFETLSAIEMVPGAFGIDTNGTPAAGQIGYPIQTMKARIEAALGDAGIPDDYSVVFTGNVEVHATVYSPGEPVMSAVQEAVDAEFPGVSNVYTDRLGRICVHGRLAKFDPATIAAGATEGAWDFTHWKVGDGAAVAGHEATVAQLRTFAFNRGLAKVINSATASPVFMADAAAAGQVVQDDASLEKFGYRSWSAQNLITRRGLLDDSDDLTETKRFATYYVENYAQPRNRVTELSLRSMRPNDPRAAIVWALLSKIDIADLVDVSVGSPGGGGFNAEPFFVEGVHENVQPLGAAYDDVTLSLDLSPQAYFTTNPFPTPT
jgi:hypothetical protein